MTIPSDEPAEGAGTRTVFRGVIATHRKSDSLQQSSRTVLGATHSGAQLACRPDTSCPIVYQR